jgi:hypothetical protein
MNAEAASTACEIESITVTRPDRLRHWIYDGAIALSFPLRAGYVERSQTSATLAFV